MMYVFFEMFLIPSIYAVWLFYSLIIKKKKWSAISNDALVGGGFVIFALLIYFWLKS